MNDPNQFRKNLPMPTNTNQHPFKAEPSTSHASFSPMGIHTSMTSLNKSESQFPNSPRSVSRMAPYPSNSNHPTNRNFHTQMWMQNHYLDGSYPSQSPSVAPSMISNLSRMSIPDDVSMLSVNTNLSGISQLGIDRRFLHTPNGQPSSASSSIENVDPNEKSEINCQLDEIINAISDSETQVRDKAIKLIRRYLQIFSARNFNRVKVKRLINEIVRLINEFLPDAQKYEQLRELTHCMYVFATPTWLDILREVIIEQRELGPVSSILCQLFDQFADPTINFLAISIIRTLLSDVKHMQSLSIIRRTARQNSIINKLLESIKNDSMDLNRLERVIFYVDVLRVLIKGSNVHKQFVIENGGMGLLLKLMSLKLPKMGMEIQLQGIDKLKNSALRTIYSLISSESRKFSEHFVECNGIDILADELSSRQQIFLVDEKIPSVKAILNMIRLMLEICCCVSDAEKLKQRKLDGPLKIILRIVPEVSKKGDALAIKFATGFICNVASSPSAKEFLTNHGAIPLLIDLAKQCLMALEAGNRLDATEILENCLIAMVNLSAKSNIAHASAFKSIAMDTNMKVLIVGVCQYGGKDNQRRILTLLFRMCSFDPSLLDEMCLLDQSDNKLPKLFELLPKCLFHCIFTYAQACNEEKAQKEREIVEKSFNLLNLLWHRNPSYVEHIQSRAKTDYNLFKLLELVEHVNTCIKILQFIDLMCKDEMIRMYYAGDTAAIHIVERCSRSTAPELEKAGVSLLKKLRLEQDEYMNPFAGVLMNDGGLNDYPMMM